MEMGPAVLGKRADGEDESIHFFVERPRMISHRKADIRRFVRRNDVAFLDRVDVITSTASIMRWLVGNEIGSGKRTSMLLSILEDCAGPTTWNR